MINTGNRMSSADYRKLIGEPRSTGASATGGRITLNDYKKFLGTPVAEPSAMPIEDEPQKKSRRASPEEDLQRECIKFVEAITPRYKVLAWLNHVPNGGKRPKGEAGKLKAMGTKKGFPDLFLPKRLGKFTGFVCELKSPVGRVSPEQQGWLDLFEEQGHLVCVCRTFDEFESNLMTYLKSATE